jgi:HSP20 family protein
MPELIIWKRREIDRLRRDMDRLLDRFWDDFRFPILPRAATEVPFLELSETETALIVKAQIPGLSPEDMDISITDDKLSIQGSFKEDRINEGEGYQKMQRRYGRFTRTIQLPCRVLVDDVEATYKDGTLTVVMPKCRVEAREVKIRVT